MSGVWMRRSWSGGWWRCGVEWRRLWDWCRLLWMCIGAREQGQRWHRVDQACRRALAFELINVFRVESILLQDLDQLTLPLEADAEAKVIPLQPRFQRPRGSFTHPPAKETTDDRSQTQS